ncbi:unnamed protein product [Thelazia callipaeda]|uniref:PlsC domain-containing protein n=1 Tax=Thelazia callipaeda TaxID=103827 RepID=A0A0N5CKF1_THECL|nr:unnamed protein product [Thelazia callipaeda]
MFVILLSVYIGWLIGLVMATVILIISGHGWGPLPHLYVKLVKFLQSFYPNSYPLTDALWPAIIKRCDTSYLMKHRTDSLSSFKFSKIPMISAFDLCADAFKAGFEAIVQDQMSIAFDSAPPFYSTLLERPGRLPFPDASRRISRRHIIGYFIATAFRYGVLLPIRLCLIMISFLFSTSAVVADQFMDMTDEQRVRVGVLYCRLFCAGIGLVAKYHNRQNRPKQPGIFSSYHNNAGIAVANHLSPNDVQVIYADSDPSEGYGFTVTGQRHGGIIWFVERIAERFIPTLWLERRSTTDRKRFMHDVLREAKSSGPVLLFPEGVCTNNTRVLQFRRAIFEDDVVIYPIAIRQNPRYGDSFWYEPKFWRYLLRVLTSWAIVYDVTYLEPQQKQPGESNQDFAQRIQEAIAQTADVESISLDGRLWYIKSEQERLKTIQMKNIAKCLKDLISKRSSGMNSQRLLNGIRSSTVSRISTDKLSYL